ncbi:putative small secreted protein [Venturia nashicola]|uniref:Putative small secreted protein n=1 Tax=Venturia nashicola TaxID=86259 RepID=A0A4Z1PFF8_9PEZI|nr:putative small secreted protein [Venturia nashicola]TLD36593.1 putative small secreted protein [Venturia nashicola]
MKTTITMPLLLASLAASQAISVKLCSDANLSGTCRTYTVRDNVCWNAPASQNNKVSSLDTLGAHCIFYQGTSCRGPSFAAVGKKLRIPANFNDKISSIKCT